MPFVIMVLPEGHRGHPYMMDVVVAKDEDDNTPTTARLSQFIHNTEIQKDKKDMCCN